MLIPNQIFLSTNPSCLTSLPSSTHSLPHLIPCRPASSHSLTTTRSPFTPSSGPHACITFFLESLPPLSLLFFRHISFYHPDTTVTLSPLPIFHPATLPPQLTSQPSSFIPCHPFYPAKNPSLPNVSFSHSVFLLTSSSVNLIPVCLPYSPTFHPAALLPSTLHLSPLPFPPTLSPYLRLGFSSHG